MSCPLQLLIRVEDLAVFLATRRYRVFPHEPCRYPHYTLSDEDLQYLDFPEDLFHAAPRSPEGRGLDSPFLVTHRAPEGRRLNRRF